MGRLFRAFVVCGAISVLAADCRADDVAALVKDLKAKDVATRVKACEGLAAVAATNEVATALCDATCDPSPKVMAAALSSLEKLRPDIHKHLATIHLDKSQAKRADAADELAKIGPKASPAVRALVAVANRDISAPMTNGRDSTSQAVWSSVRAVKTIGITDEEAAVAVGAIATSTAAANTRVAALEALAAWSKGEKRDDVLFKTVRPMFADKPAFQIAACKAVAEFGEPAKKEFGKVVDALKLSADKRVREAATAAADTWAK